MDGILYLMIGTKHAEHLVVSLRSLRQHWQGSVAIICDNDGMRFCRDACGMHELPGVELVPFDYQRHRKKRRGSGGVYCAKTMMHELTPFDRTVFLDADTLVCGDLTPVFSEGEQVKVTQWMDWVSTGKMMAGRIKEWQQQAPAEVERQLSRPWPAINTGVIGFTKDSWPTMNAWAEMTARNIRFICDEIAMQLIFPDWPCVVLDDRYNTSPCYRESRLKHGVALDELTDLDRYCVEHNGDLERVVPNKTVQELLAVSQQSPGPCDTAVWHGHGMKFIKKPWGRASWWPAYRIACNENFCNLSAWTPWHSGRHRLAKPWGRCKLVQYLTDPCKFN